MGGSRRDTEIIHLPSESSCNVGEIFPFGRGGLISEQDIFMCDPNDSTLCYIYDINTLQSQDTGVSVLKRPWTSSTIIGNQLWITGGRLGANDGPRTDITELVTVEESKPGPPLHLPLSSHCVVTVNSTTVAVLGGLSLNSSDSGISETWFYHIKDNLWTPERKADMNTARRNFGCLSINTEGEDFIFVAGGHLISSTEMFNIAANEWENGPDLNFATSALSLAWLTQDQSILILGGVVNEKYSDKIYQSKCESYKNMETCEWIELGQKLKIPRGYSTIVQMPDLLS